MAKQNTIQANYELAAILGGKIPPRNDSNVRPGDMMGLTVEQVQQYIKRQKKCKGFSQALVIGDNNTIRISLPGTARVLLGFAINWKRLPAGQTQPSGNATFKVNNEIVIEDTDIFFYGPDYTDEEYYFIPRPLSGNDDITMTLKAVEYGYTLTLNFYYL